MIANRFRSIGWTGCVCAALLGFYLVSQTVATKRAELAKIDRRIASTQREIRDLETEIGTRGGMAQIEKWNSGVYGLQAPGADQFVQSSIQLASFAPPQAPTLDPAVAAPRPAVQQASFAVPDPVTRVIPDKPAVPAVDPAPSPPMVRAATFVEPKRQAMAPDAANANVHEVSVEKVRPKAKARPAAPTKMTALDDNWLADAVGAPSGSRSHKGRP